MLKAPLMDRCLTWGQALKKKRRKKKRNSVWVSEMVESLPYKKVQVIVVSENEKVKFKSLW